MSRKKSAAAKAKSRRDAHRRHGSLVAQGSSLINESNKIELTSMKRIVTDKNETTDVCSNIMDGEPDVSNTIIVKEVLREMIRKICHRAVDQKQKLMIRRKNKRINNTTRNAESRRLERKKLFSNKYLNDINFRRQHITRNMVRFHYKYHSNSQFRSTHNSLCTSRIVNQYHSNDVVRKHYNSRLLNRYHRDEEFRTNHNSRMLTRYHSNEQFRFAHNSHLLSRYHSDEQFRKDHNVKLLRKYYSNNLFRLSMIRKSFANYLKNASQRREQQKTYQESRRILRKYSIVKQHSCSIIHRVVYTKSLEAFRKIIQEGPDYVCIICRIMFFRDQVMPYVENNYLEKWKNNEAIDEIRLYSNNYSKLNSTWICKMCSEKLKRQQIPSRSYLNGLQVGEIPLQLKGLNDLEKHLIALRLPFMKIVNLMSGRISNKYAQKGTQGPLHCVPADVEETVLSLPRPVDQSMMVRLQLKRRLKYKAVWEEQWINPTDVREALLVLKRSHPEYEHIQIIEINENYLMTDEAIKDDSVAEEISGSIGFDKDDNETEKEKSEKHQEQREQRLALGDVSGDESNDEEMIEDEQDIRSKYNLGTAACTQPADLSSLVISNETLHAVAPAEKNQLSSLLTDKNLEILAFPHLFPDGRGSFDEERKIKLNWKEYCKTRLFSSDLRFASDPSYIFYLQYLGDLKQAFSGVNVAFRKQLPMTAGQTTNENHLKLLFSKDMIYRYLQSVRGSPQYWNQRLKDLFGMNRQLGIPTFFITLSCADMRWKEFLDTMARHNNEEVKDKYTFQEKATFIRRNPVLAARMFERRFKTFFNMFIKGGALCLGKVRDWFIRIEMQMRGSPHSHMPLWVDEAPKYNGLKTDERTRLDIVKFCDKYISTRFPLKEQDAELHETIREVQTHSVNHSKSCLKFHKTTCRFGFPRPIARRTFIVEPFKAVNEEDIKRVKEAKQILRNMNIELNQMEKENVLRWTDFDALLKKYEWTYEYYEWSLTAVHNRPTMIHKREPNARWVNQYNEEMLRAWNANMDVQYVLDPYACARYLMSYTTKPEREMSLLLEATHKECREGNMSVRGEMKKLTGTFFNHRQVSVQEAIYRATKMPLTYSSRGFVFVPAHSNSCKFLKPRRVLQEMNPDDDDIYMSNLADKYFNRPIDKEFDICMAEFASEYEIVSIKRNVKNPRTPIKPLQKLKFAVKKRCDRSAIIRYPYFSRDLDSENYFENILSLYVPIRNREDMKKPYESFYREGEMFDHRLQSMRKVKDIVCENRQKYESNFEVANEVESLLNELSNERKGDEWAEIVSNKEKSNRSNDEIYCENNPDFDLIRQRPKGNLTIDLKQTFRPTNEMRPLLESLNEEQQEVFYSVRKWCIGRLFNSNIQPIRLFITGGAGTGKSHLLKCLHYEATKIFSRKKHLEPDENIDEIHTLITAFTGAAAVNVGGVTIHSAFGINTRSNRIQEPLSCDKLNSYRCKLGSLKLLFVDEVSLVSSELWGAMHARLGQVMGTNMNNIVFGNIGVIAIGDFYQCAPVASLSIYSSMLWTDHFECVELSVNERQKGDGLFSQMLNRIRKLKKKEIMKEEDQKALEKCHERYLKGDFNPEALHLFAKNTDVDAHNNEMIDRICADIRLFPEIDRKGNEILSNKNKFGKNSHIPLRLAVNARVMITKNISVIDGLANGVTGKVVGFVENSEKNVLRILVKCDTPNAGRIHRSVCQDCRGKDTICVTRESDQIEKYDNHSISAASSKQFPLKLSWAMTIHKAQGLTVDELVMSTKDLFGTGMGYTGLSRNKSIECLFLQDFYVKKFYCDENVEKMMSQMKPLDKNRIVFRDGPDYLNLLFHNIEGLQSNLVALRNHHLTKKAHLICVAETWIDQTSENDFLDIDGYRFLHHTRYNSFSMSHPFRSLKRGGVGLYIRDNIEIQQIDSSSITNLEYVSIELEREKIVIITCYRSPKQEKKEFLTSLTNLLATIDLNNRVLIVGDFNENSLGNESRLIDSKLHDLYFINMFQNLPTTNDRTSLDCVYTNFISEENQHRYVGGSFYSYHEPIGISVDLNNSKINIREQNKEKIDDSFIEIDPSYHRTTTSNFFNTENSRRKDYPTENQLQENQKMSLLTFISESNGNVNDSFEEIDSYIMMLNEEEREEKFFDQLLLAGLHKVKVLADGNCFFRAVSHQLYGHENNHLQIRASAIDHIISNYSHYEEFLNFRYDNIDDYIIQMSKDGIYAEHLAIMATTIVIKHNIVVHRLDDTPSLIPASDTMDDQIHLCYDRQHRHYDSILCTNNSRAYISTSHLRVLT